MNSHRQTHPNTLAQLINTPGNHPCPCHTRLEVPYPRAFLRSDRARAKEVREYLKVFFFHHPGAAIRDAAEAFPFYRTPDVGIPLPTFRAQTQALLRDGIIERRRHGHYAHVHA